MALFSRKKNTEKSEKTEKKEAVATKATSARTQAGASARDLTHILKHARITEKASMHQAQSVYVFDIDADASKRDVMQAVRSLYGVTPRKVAVVNVPRKNIRSMRTGRTGVKGGGRKAYVYLKQGETITIG